MVNPEGEEEKVALSVVSNYSFQTHCYVLRIEPDTNLNNTPK